MAVSSGPFLISAQLVSSSGPCWGCGHPKNTTWSGASLKSWAHSAIVRPPVNPEPSQCVTGRQDDGLNFSADPVPSALQELFCVCGALKRARLVHPGVAEVVFVKKDDAITAYKKYNNRCLDGKLGESSYFPFPLLTVYCRAAGLRASLSLPWGEGILVRSLLGLLYKRRQEGAVSGGAELPAPVPPALGVPLPGT